MRILSISLDAAILDPASVVAQRQLAYLDGQYARILVVSPGRPERISLSHHVTAERVGGRNKVVCLLRAIYLVVMRLRDEAYDVVISQDVLYTGLCAYLYARRRKKPFAVQLHGDYVFNAYWTAEHWAHRFVNVWGLFLLRRATGIRVVSERIRRECVRRDPGLASRITVFPIGTDLAHFSPEGPTGMVSPYVLFVGRLHPEKTPLVFCDVAICLLHHHPSLHVVIVGEGALKEEMQRKFVAARVSDRVLYTGRQTPDELAAWYRGAVCLVHPSDWDGWGMVMIEAMACGCPVVSTDSGAAGEAVRDGENGVVVPVRDVDGLVRGVERLFTDATFRERLSWAAAEEAKKWSFDASVIAYRRWYERLI